MVAKHAGARGARGAPRCRATAWRPSGRGRTGRARAARRPSGSTARAPPPVTGLPLVSHKVASARAAHCRAATDPMSVSGGHHRARACVAVAQASGAWRAIETCRQGMRDVKFGGCMHCCLRGGRGTRQQALVHGRQPAQLDLPVGARAGHAQRGERLRVEGRAAQRRVPRLAAARGGRQADLRQGHGVQGSTLSLALRRPRWSPGRPAAVPRGWVMTLSLARCRPTWPPGPPAALPQVLSPCSVRARRRALSELAPRWSCRLGVQGARLSWAGTPTRPSHRMWARSSGP